MVCVCRRIAERCKLASQWLHLSRIIRYSEVLCVAMMIRAVDPLQHTSMYQRAEEGFYFVGIFKPIRNFISFSSSVWLCDTFSDSEDSDGEGGLGNVSRVIIRPPGHSGKGNCHFFPVHTTSIFTIKIMQQNVGICALTLPSKREI